MANARKSAVRALIRVLCEDGYSNLVAAAEFSRAELSERDKALANAIFYGVLERRITLDHVLRRHVTGNFGKLSPFVLNVLRAGAYQILYMDKIPGRAAVDESVSLVRYSKERSASGLVNAVLRGLLRAGAWEPPAGDGVQALSVRYSCAGDIVQGLIADYGPALAQGFLAASFGPAPVTVRVNTLRTTPDALAESLAQSGIAASRHEILPGALNLPARGDIAALPQFQSGLFHVQDAASQLACAALAPKAGERVLDCCASPGGKTATAAELMGGEGEIVAGDLHEQRAGLIRDTARRLGIGCIQARVLDAEKFVPKLGLFDKILCDVPCSGLGVLRKKPEIRYKLVTSLDNLTEIQYRILCTSVRYLKPGGVLVYSTCTLRRAENEDIIDRFLAENAGFTQTAPDDPAFRAYARMAGEPRHNLTLFPHIHKTDGFFISVLRRSGGGTLA